MAKYREVVHGNCLCIVPAKFWDLMELNLGYC